MNLSENSIWCGKSHYLSNKKNWARSALWSPHNNHFCTPSALNFCWNGSRRGRRARQTLSCARLRCGLVFGPARLQQSDITHACGRIMNTMASDDTRCSPERESQLFITRQRLFMTGRVLHCRCSVHIACRRRTQHFRLMRKKGSGCPRQTSSRTDRLFVRLVTSDSILCSSNRVDQSRLLFCFTFDGSTTVIGVELSKRGEA